MLMHEWHVCFITRGNSVWLQLLFLSTRSLCCLNCTFVLFVRFVLLSITTNLLIINEVKCVLLVIVTSLGKYIWLSSIIGGGGGIVPSYYLRCYYRVIAACGSISPAHILLILFIRSVSQRLDAVQEILESNSVTLNPVRSLLSHLPDLDRGISSIYHRKVRV